MPHALRRLCYMVPMRIIQVTSRAPPRVAVPPQISYPVIVSKTSYQPHLPRLRALRWHHVQQIYHLNPRRPFATAPPQAHARETLYQTPIAVKTQPFLRLGLRHARRQTFNHARPHRPPPQRRLHAQPPARQILCAQARAQPPPKPPQPEPPGNPARQHLRARPFQHRRHVVQFPVRPFHVRQQPTR